MNTTASAPIHVVLVRSIYSRNVGSVSRAMGNMGGSRLILIDPKCEMNLEARQGAAGSQRHLLERTVYQSWDEFYKTEGDGVRIAFCARNKRDTDALKYPERLNHLIKNNELRLPIYLIFGPEDHGLETADLEWAHFISQLPTYGQFNSLNLAHAVLLALYITQSNLSDFAQTATANTPEQPYTFPEPTIQKWLEALGFTVGDRRRDALTVLNRLILQKIPTQSELKMLEAIIHQTLRKLK